MDKIKTAKTYLASNIGNLLIVAIKEGIFVDVYIKTSERAATGAMWIANHGVEGTIGGIKRLARNF